MVGRPSQPARWPIAAVWVAAALGLVVFALRIIETAQTDVHLRHPAGVLAALADDARHGLLYRPLYDEALGYGGTRYFPLSFLLQGALLDAFGVRAAVYGFAALSTLVFVSGFLRLCTALGVSGALSALGVVAALSSRAMQFSVVSGRADVLPLGLVLWGTAFVISRPGTIRAALCFTLAFAVKATAAYGLAAALVHLAVRSRTREAARLALFTMAGWGTVLIAIQWCSDGRGMAVLAQSAAGGATVAQMIRGPIVLLQSIRDNEPSLIMWSTLVVGVVASRPLRESLYAPSVLLIAAAASLGAVMGSPGMSYNHLVDINTAAILTLLVAASSMSQGTVAAGFAAAAVGLAFGLAPIRSDTGNVATARAAGGLQMVADKVKDAGPVLAENPLVALLAGQRPYVLDPFMTCAFAKQDAAFLNPLLERVRRKEFGAVVLQFDPREAATAAWYRDTHFGPGLREAVLGAYEWSETLGPSVIFRPKHLNISKGD